MRIQIQNGLPIVSMTLKQDQKSIHLTNVLFDTGCAATVFDTDLLSRIGIQIDFMNGKAKRMYGIGGTSEICYEQIIPNLKIDTIQFTSFPIQLGSIQEPYGFDGILGIDFMLRAKLKADFESLQIFYSS
ncbi:retropepsin-like aspartic protease [Paenibacillus dendritiformis]|uniref:Peptidase A2 domain-containing protein n=1 Tax=Paenibacillus dendritiformis C454 TaxID=1131935 RepID=H3SPZ6_9BACL|nr:retropepsin-like aspartic protease [Paenibacillus dendritiformis]EHQ58865.1 hypothetical protein PDENDC454_28285 [Paenibacillus dendritiformis C454]CAH8769284.1 retropepsin-like domain-containing protein [Paenibacillus dendritiformis]